MLNIQSDTARIINRVEHVIVKNSSIHGNGLFAANIIHKGCEIAYFEGYEIEYNTIHSVTIENKYIEPTGVLKFLNHSCIPNSEFIGRWLIASRHIESGGEITIDYRKTESDISHHFECDCGSPNCSSRL